MIKKIFGVSLLAIALAVAFGVMLLPTFFTKDISRIALEQTVELEHILSGDKPLELVFFGYSGCSDVCTPRLGALAAFYEGVDSETKKHLRVRFIDISTPKDPTLPQRFAEYFHKDFVGISLKPHTLRDYTKPFELFFAPSLQDATEFDHTAHLYLLSKRGGKKAIRYIYTAYPYDFKQIQKDIKELLDE
jgi:protein SCO1